MGRNWTEAQIKSAKAQEADMAGKADLAEEMTHKEEVTSQRMQQVLARFYPMLQSQEAERMVTILMLNHNLSIQSLTVTMPERDADLDWYQYSGNAAAYGQPAGEEEGDALSLYTAKVLCVAEGKKEDLWGLVDDISVRYPAISISNMEWSLTERVADNKSAQTQEGETVAAPATVTTDRLTIGLEIYMCNQ